MPTLGWPMIKNKSTNDSTLVLLSGGIDSAACLDFYIRKGLCVSALFVNYGQAAADKEAPAAKTIAEHFGVSLRRVNCSNLQPKSSGTILGRNAFLAFLGLMEFKELAGLITMGIHAGTSYWDCSPSFICQIQSLYDAYTGGRVQFAAPFLNWSKAEIWQYSQAQGVPTHLTYSCELGLTQPCGQCQSCHDLEALHVGK